MIFSIIIGNLSIIGSKKFFRKEDFLNPIHITLVIHIFFQEKLKGPIPPQLSCTTEGPACLINWFPSYIST